MTSPRAWRIAPGALLRQGSSRSASAASHVWREAFVPVDWRGAYSVDKLRGLLRYTATVSPVRVALVLLLTPLPALAACLLIEWLLPLADPALGWRGNKAFLVRTWLRCWLTSFAVDSFIELYLPKLRLPRWRLLLMNAAQGAVASAAVVAVAEAAGVFPIPFSPTVTMPVYAVFCWALRVRCDREARRNDATPQETRQTLARVMETVNFGVVLIYVYSAFCMLFALTPARWQAPMTLALVALKAFATRGDWRRAQRLLPAGANDLATAHVAFGAQYFHSLFVAACLQKARSLEIQCTVDAFTLLYPLTTLRELRDRIARVRALRAGLDGASTTSAASAAATSPLRELARRWQQSELAASAAAAAPFPRETWLGSHHASAAVQQDPREPAEAANKALAPLSPAERAYLEAARALHQCREATLLRLYVDIFVPLVFFVFVATIKFLPNGAYMPFLHTNDLAELAVRLGVQLGVKLLTLALLLHTLRGDAGSPGGLAQLAFALERMAVVVHAKSLFVVLCVFDFPLLHNGNDLAFQFAWLRDPPEGAASGGLQL